MKELSLKEFYAQSLELKAPWKVVEVKIDGEARQVCTSVWNVPVGRSGEIRRPTSGRKSRTGRNAPGGIWIVSL
jgi:hypothetical protein